MSELDAQPNASSEALPAVVPDPAGMQHDATGRYSEKNQVACVRRMVRQQHELSQRQFNAIPLLLQGLSDAQVAQQLGVDRVTVFRWRKQRRFAAELERQRQAVLQQQVTRLQSMLSPALDILQRQIAGEDPKTALRAASILLRIATPARLERLANASDAPLGTRSPQRRQRRQPPARRSNPLMDELEAFINAPLPGEPGYPSAATAAACRDDERLRGKKGNW